ncbi:hypothetical protein Moror_797 [Moniliophthora roreri MCA 2997]|uniref:DUF6534 domain-containing protein n=1 Tax=Moniliophthora roreri (strain MCA 2997) TaxID=1381753 RepID=V2YDX9_MONRO|nr:hypothetical protein Moror_797 [Moniliophthora roreri MCA 2997]
MALIGDLDKSLGGLLAGTWVNSYFFMIELIMCYQYFARYRSSDPVWLKIVVGTALAVDFTSTINHYACVYLYTITHWGDDSYLTRQYWPIPVYLVTTGASAWIVQHFLIYRFWMLSKNSYIAVVLVMTSMAGMAGSIATAVIIVQHPGYDDRDTVRIPVTIWLGLSAITDVSITAILIYTLQRMKTNFRKTRNMIKRLTTLAIQTGTPGSVVATIALIIYLNDTESNISVGVAFSLGRVYALTMLHNLNSRAYVRHNAQEAEDTDMHISISETFLRGLQTETRPDARGEGIHVHRTAVVHIDGQKSVPLEHIETLPADLHDRRNDVKPSVPQRDSLSFVPMAV